MGIYFNDKVQQAFNDVFNCWEKERILRGQIDLKRLADSDEPDAEACVLLSRTFAGPEFVWNGSGLAKDDALCYYYLQKGVRLGSAIGVLQLLRIPGAITPVLRNDTTIMSPSEAFTKVLAAAHQGDAYCQYVIGNVFYWNDYTYIGEVATALLEQRVASKHRNLFSKLTHRLVQSKVKEYITLAKEEAIYWFELALENGFTLFPGNLRNLYIDLKQFEKARSVAERGAAAGNPEMMYWCGIYAEKDDKNFDAALAWYEKGSALNDPNALEEAGDMYFWGKGGRPIDGRKGVSFYERGALADNTYCMVQCVFAYACGIKGVPQDWGRAAYWIEQASQKITAERYLDILPFIGFMLLHGLGVRRDLELGVQALLKAEKDDADRIANGRWEYLPEIRSLWQEGLAYAYEKGYVDGIPNVEKSAYYYSMVSDNKDFVPRLLPHTWPHNHLYISKQRDGEMAYHRTTNFNWEMVVNEIKAGQCFMFLNQVMMLSDYLSDLQAVGFSKQSDGQYDVTFNGYIIIKNESFEVRYLKTMPLETAISVAKNFYDNGDIPDLSKWRKSYWENQGGLDSYILEVDRQEYVVDDYDDIDANIIAALQGVQEGLYSTLFMYLRDLSTGAFFIYKADNKVRTFLVHALVPEPKAEVELLNSEGFIDVEWKLYELETANLIAIHMWLQNFRMEDTFPVFDGWKSIPVSEDGTYRPLK